MLQRLFGLHRPPSLERRELQRVVSVVQVALAPPGSDQWTRAVSSDISMKGIGLHIFQPLETGTRLMVAMTVDTHCPALRVTATVVWCRPTANGWDAGLVFTSMPSTVKLSLRAFLDAATQTAAEDYIHGLL